LFNSFRAVEYCNVPYQISKMQKRKVHDLSQLFITVIIELHGLNATMPRKICFEFLGFALIYIQEFGPHTFL
jgi:hypothetical protein